MQTRRQPTLILLSLLALVALALSACQVSINRNPDGSLRLDTSMTGAALQTEIQQAINDPLITRLTVDLNDGYMLISGERKRLNSDASDKMSFRLDLGASDGRLTAAISNAQIDSVPVDAARLALWNERIASRLTAAFNKRPNASLQSVTITPQSVSMTWRIATARSK